MLLMKPIYSHAKFGTTRWSLIQQAARYQTSQHHSQTESSIEEWVNQYRSAMYAFLRARKLSREDAEDCLQGFLSYLFEKNLLHKANKEKGKFRSFILGVLKNYVSNISRYKTAQKRGGGKEHIAIEDSDFLQDSHTSPDEIFDREWAKSILSIVQDKLATQIDDEILLEFLSWNQGGRSYQSAADEIGCSLSAFKSKVLRMRRLFQQLLKEEIAQTLSVSDEFAIDEEIRALKSCW